MTLVAQNEQHSCQMKSTLARLLYDLAMWQEKRHQKRRLLYSLSEIPDHLRHDIGLDGAAPIQRPQRRGRSFMPDVPQDSRLSTWQW
ncbi:hypothetical protein [Paracoccus aerodenitrificans]|uniref:hypothetical protein n=1 Tax=Paracoccus aerodenitrificans TaxID=3017781 RepID=UPI0022F0F529|nr:hypothetical protein [Paracoccus aerodenitrificans]WBU65002.1 hypothetical protein PAE61_06100 [Paracoccus aerodenitrificans]